MTKRELSFLCERRTEKHLFKRKHWAGCLLLALLFLLLGGSSGVWAKPLFLPAVGVLWQDFFTEHLDSEAESAAYFGFGYTKGQGLSLHVFENIPLKVQVDGTTVVTRAPIPRIEDILRDAGIVLGTRDRAEVKIVAGNGHKEIPEVDVIRIRTRIVTEEVALPFPTRRVQDPSLPSGEIEVREPGRSGLLLKKFEVTTENGKEVRRREFQEEILRHPKPQIIAYGTRAPAAAQRISSRGGLPGERIRQVLTMTATAYTYTGNSTATGVWPYVGGVAVDPAVIPLGSKLYIEGYGPAQAVDTGGLIKGDRVDLFFESAEECFSWGKRKVNVYVFE